MVMNKLIEPELKPVPPIEGIFLCSIVLIVFNNNLLPVYHEGGDRVFLPVSRHLVMT